MAKNTVWFTSTDADGSFCTTDSQRHVDVVSGTTAAISMNQAHDRGDDIADVDEEELTPSSRHATYATTADDCGTAANPSTVKLRSDHHGFILVSRISR
jgi:hypothetical protein